MRHRHGFTLIELMIVVVVVGILAAIAIPRYADVSRESKRAEAGPILSQAHTLQERFQARTGGYALVIDSIEGGSTIPKSGRFFDYGIAPHATGFCLVATPNAAGVRAGLDPMSLDAERRFHRSADCTDNE